MYVYVFLKSRMSVSLDTAFMSPSSSFSEPQMNSHKKEVTALQGKISELLNAEESFKEEIRRLKNNLDVKNTEIDKHREDKKILEQLIAEMNAEIKVSICYTSYDPLLFRS